MRKRFMQLAAVLLAIILCVPVSWAATTNDDGEIMIRVGLASTSSHVAQGTMEAAHLENNTGYGSGYRFGYYDDDLNFVELGRTDEDITQIAVLKTQNLYYGYVSSLGKTTYSSQITSDWFRWNLAPSRSPAIYATRRPIQVKYPTTPVIFLSMFLSPTPIFVSAVPLYL